MSGWNSLGTAQPASVQGLEKTTCETRPSPRTPPKCAPQAAPAEVQPFLDWHPQTGGQTGWGGASTWLKVTGFPQQGLEKQEQQVPAEGTGAGSGQVGTTPGTRYTQESTYFWSQICCSPGLLGSLHYHGWSELKQSTD